MKVTTVPPLKGKHSSAQIIKRQLEYQMFDMQLVCALCLVFQVSQHSTCLPSVFNATLNSATAIFFHALLWTSYPVHHSTCVEKRVNVSSEHLFSDQGPLRRWTEKKPFSFRCLVIKMGICEKPCWPKQQGQDEEKTRTTKQAAGL